eukprot:1593012-Ditylum_brightwellii.AAC.1
MDDTASHITNKDSNREVDVESNADTDTSSVASLVAFENEDSSILINQGEEEIMIENTDDFLMTSFHPDEIIEELDNDDEDNDSLNLHDLFITTYAGDITAEVNEQTVYGFKFSGCNILNSDGSLLAQKQHELKVGSYISHHMQRFFQQSKGKYIPLLYLETMLFPSIYWKTAGNSCSIVGAILSSLLNNAMSQDGYATSQQHIHTRLTSLFASTSTDPRYIAHCFDIMSNISASFSETRVIMSKGLTVDDDKKCSLNACGNKESSFLCSIDSKQQVRNLCTSQKYCRWSHFLTFTANQNKYFGTKIVHKRIYKKGWQKYNPKYAELPFETQAELAKAMSQASS